LLRGRRRTQTFEAVGIVFADDAGAALDHYAAAAQSWDYEGWQDMHAASKAPAT
jgi:hypothetical protein